MNIFEIIGTIFGLLCVYLTVKQKVLSWPIGIISTVAFGILFWQIKLYADMGEQVFYLVTGFYGWYLWKHGGEKKTELKVSLLKNYQRILSVLGIITASWLVGYLLKNYTDASLPYLDATTTVMSFAAQILLMKKKFENWILWIIIDVMALGIYAYKGVYLTTGLYALFLGLASSGCYSWWKAWIADKKICYGKSEKRPCLGEIRPAA